MRALKTIVVVLGALVVVAFGLRVYGLSQNWHRLNEKAPAPVAAGAARPSAAWGKVGLGLPADSRIQSVTPAGSLVVVQVVSGSEERLVVVDPASGAVVGTFAVTGKP